MRVKELVSVSVLLLALVAAACGTGDEAEEAAEPEPEATPEDEAEPVEEPETEEEPEVESEPSEGLHLGSILPETGPVAFLVPPMFAGLEMALDEINDAGGVLGAPVQLSSGDEAGDAAVAASSAQRLLSDGVHAIVGAAASGMSLAIIDSVTQAGVVQCSPSSTAPTFTDYDDGGFFFRTAITDALQGLVLAEAMISDGHDNVVLLGKGDDYGRGLVATTREGIEDAGGTVLEEIIFDPEAASFDSEVQQVVNASPDAIGIVATDEGAQLLQGLLEAGFTPDQFYSAEGMKSADLPALVDPNNPNVIDGMRGTAPSPVVNEEFQSRLAEREPDLELTLFADSTYDCTMIIALAATAAGSTDPGDFVSEMINVTRDGTTCTSYAECVELLEQGEDIDFQGASGPLEFTDDGEPSRGIFEIWEVRDGGEFAHVRDIEVGET